MKSEVKVCTMVELAEHLKRHGRPNIGDSMKNSLVVIIPSDRLDVVKDPSKLVRVLFDDYSVEKLTRGSLVLVFYMEPVHYWTIQRVLENRWSHLQWAVIHVSDVEDDDELFLALMVNGHMVGHENEE